MHEDILLIINYTILFPWYYAVATGRCEEAPEVSADRNPFSSGAALWNLKGQGALPGNPNSVTVSE